MVMIQFKKEVKDHEDHLSKWQERGLAVDSHDRAKRYLSFIGYYRLSAYSIPFQQVSPSNPTTPHQFKANTSFDDILNLYVFDRELRLLVMDAIERIEVAIRAQVCHVLCCRTNDAFWYTNEDYFKQSYSHKRLLANIERQLLNEKNRLERDERAIEKRSITQDEKDILKNRVQKENFLRHYLSTYDSPKLPPAWMMIEMLTWGDLSHLYSGLTSNQYKKEIAQNLGLNLEILESCIKSFQDIRNICAHHSRLWNKEHGRSIKIPKSNAVQWLENDIILSNSAINYNKRTYIVLVAMQTVLYKISPNSSWAKRLKLLIEGNKFISLSKSNMGMPDLWYDDPFWDKALN